VKRLVAADVWAKIQKYKKKDDVCDAILMAIYCRSLKESSES
jgi:hypothetical protein